MIGGPGLKVNELLQRWGWLVLLALVPLYSFITPALTPALLAVPALLALVWVGAPATERRTPLDWPIMLLVAMVLVSLWATFSIAFSLAKIAGMVFGVGLFYAMLAPTRLSPRALGEMTAVFLALGTAIAGFGLLSTAWSAKIPVLTAIAARLPAALISLPGAENGLQPNEVAGVLVWVAPVALALAAVLWHKFGSFAHEYGTGKTVLAGVLLILMALGTSGVLVLTQSRGGLFGLALAGLVMLFLAGPRVRRVTLMLLPLVALVVILLYGQPLKALYMYAVSGAAATPEPAHFFQSLSQRVEIWSRAIYGIEDFAVTGMGLNTFRKLAGVLYPLTVFGPETDLGHAHNIWLQVALDLGIPGLVAFIALWLAAIAMLVQSLRRSPVMPPGLRALAVGLLGALVGTFAYGLTDTVALGARPGFLWWMLLALVTLVWLRSRPADSSAIIRNGLE